MNYCWARFFACAALASLSLGCGDNPPPRTAANAPPKPEASPMSDSAAQVQAAAEPGGAVEVQIRDYDAIARLIDSKRGKVVVMDCWSTWCQPCMKEFHNLVELHQQYGPEKLACISLSFNYEGAKRETPEEHRDEVLRFLREQRATFDNLIASVPAEDLYKLLAFKTASVPAVFVYNQQGELARQFSGEVSYDEVRKLVGKLLPGKTKDSE
ncbi:MAG TPA: TlpA disulfide reductase family protein [Pirellulales bacterium]|nr:TlpA disulfide reductase family protein [Pirellulales bacterium]